MRFLKEGKEASNMKPGRDEPCSKVMNDAEHYWF